MAEEDKEHITGVTGCVKVSYIKDIICESLFKASVMCLPTYVLHFSDLELKQQANIAYARDLVFRKNVDSTVRALLAAMGINTNNGAMLAFCCKKCGHIFNVEKITTACPECASTHVRLY